MGMLDNVQVLIEWAEKLALRNRHNREQGNFNIVLVAMYSLSGQGQHSVDLSDLLALGFSKRKVFEAIEVAESKGWLIDCASLDSQHCWIPNQKACRYVEALLEEKID